MMIISDTVELPLTSNIFFRNFVKKIFIQSQQLIKLISMSIENQICNFCVIDWEFLQPFISSMTIHLLLPIPLDLLIFLFHQPLLPHQSLDLSI